MPQKPISKVFNHDGATDLVLCRMTDDTFVIAEGPIVNGSWTRRISDLGTCSYSWAKIKFNEAVDSARYDQFHGPGKAA